jgi:hypothetical protein
MAPFLNAPVVFFQRLEPAHRQGAKAVSLALGVELLHSLKQIALIGLERQQVVAALLDDFPGNFLLMQLLCMAGGLCAFSFHSRLAPSLPQCPG